jgi:hypothetical protein
LGPTRVGPPQTVVNVPAISLGRLLEALRAKGCNPRRVSATQWIATCPCCGARDGLHIYILEEGDAVN